MLFGWLLSLAQTLRPMIRFFAVSRSRTISMTTSSFFPPSSRAFPSASAWVRLRGKPSRSQPFLQSLSWRLFRIIGTVIASGTSSPLSIKLLAILPSSVLFLMLSLKMAPVSICGIPYLFCTTAPWVPLPLPFGPKIRMFICVFPLECSRPTAVIAQWPQEGAQLVALQLPQDAPPALVFPTFPAKADISLWVRVDLHSGQATATFSSRLRKRTSNVSPHFRHLNS